MVAPGTTLTLHAMPPEIDGSQDEDEQQGDTLGPGDEDEAGHCIPPSANPSLFVPQARPCRCTPGR
jgi:hypothetical protein